MEELKTLDGAKNFLNNIPEECKKNLMAVMKEELELLKQYKIEFAVRTMGPSNNEKGEECYEREKFDLDSRDLEAIFQDNHITTTILSDELIEKIQKRSLNRKEAEEVVSILSDKCPKGQKTNNPTHWTLNNYSYELIK